MRQAPACGAPPEARGGVNWTGTWTVTGEAVVGRDAGGAAVTVAFGVGSARTVVGRRPDGQRPTQDTNVEVTLTVTPDVPVTVRVSSDVPLPPDWSGGLLSRVVTWPESGTFQKTIGRFRRVDAGTLLLDVDRNQPLRAGETLFLECFPGW
ncbi:hypothetical protein [Deinococcus soli (ex Cha et al. 2016)]|uniref:Uncharacterized protein n=2 Tax=Deinococcus soli (ex Cha et al. 2016) TaxID=1309411 RepID=A0AAE3XCU3_9DEIO|nr:hypothetical protein [Deinococcus soli (ex Cha et al. 2016)]MDR6218543.1 hypothetical protein [Deinococcus soli (ex Cha et al. 2016)]MDR6329283.1 hypothetical protein [Deinococcus soli (ex Cha et al. 2016)]MDR6751556.1 hypothetical protein [Deinococcus soli (ex Cha et al. 2016)]